MRVSPAVSRNSYRCALAKATLLTVAMLATVCCGAVALAANPEGSAKPAATPAKKKRAAVAKEPAPAALPTGHVGQEYGTRIGGVLLDAGVPQCTPPKGLPDGLELDCATMTIHGHPQAAVEKAAVSFTVSDIDRHHVVDLSFTLNVLDGPDVVQWVATPSKAKGPKNRDVAAVAAPAELSAPVVAPLNNAGRQARAAASAAGAGKPVPSIAMPIERYIPASSRVLDERPETETKPAAAPAARVVPAVAALTPSRMEASAPVETSPPLSSGSQVEITIDPLTPVVEGATVIQGKVKLINSRGLLSSLCVGLKLTDTRVTSVGTEVSHAALKPESGNTCTAFEAPVSKDGQFTMTMTQALLAGFVDDFEVRFSTTKEELVILSGSSYTISLELPEPKLEVTSLIRDGVKTISGTCDPSPEPALSTSTSAKTPVVGNLPRIVVRVHAPGAPSYEWPEADLTVGSQTQKYEEASVTAGGGCAFSVTLSSALTAGEAIQVVMQAPPTRYYGRGKKKEVTWRNEQEGKDVFTALAVTPPVMQSQPAAFSPQIVGLATPSVTNGATVNIAVVSDDDYQDLRDDDGSKTVRACLTADEAAADSGRFLPLTLPSGTGAFATTDKTGHFTLKLVTPLVEGQRFHLVEILPAHSILTADDRRNCRTAITEVKGELDWGRIHADFTAGVLISNDSTDSTTGATGAGSGNFSQAHQFYALTVEKTWSLPGCYLRVFSHRDEPRNADPTPKDARSARAAEQIALDKKNRGRRYDPEVTPDQCYDWKAHKLYDAKKVQHFLPGISTYFQTRLTAIPVSTVASNNSTTAATALGSAVPAAAATGAATAAGTTTSMMPSANLLTTAQTAKVEVGVYFPFLISRWEFDHQPNALFIAPLGKVGFNTVTGPSTINTISAMNTIQSQTFEQVYNFWSYGARIGHMELTHSENRAPETYSYLDISIGPYSNLQSYICRQSDTPSTATNSECSVYPEITVATDSRKRLYRLDIEGLLKVPKTAFYVGLNANIGQKTLGATHLDGGFAAPDDLRFFFGTKFDIASVLTKFNLGAH